MLARQFALRPLVCEDGCHEDAVADTRHHTCRFGAFHFSQAALPLLLKATQEKYPPTLIFTGATASVKSNAMMSSFATGKWALRALAQSLGKEFGPQGVHVGHAIIDGVIDIPRTKEYMKDAGPDAKISPDAVSYSFSDK